MKSIVMFVAGAIMAAGLVFFLTRREAPPAPVAVAENQQPAVPEAPAATVEPAPVPAVETPLRSETVAPAPRPSAMPRRRERPAATTRPAPPAKVATPEPAPASPAPASQPQQTAQNTPPIPQTGGPIIPMEPQHLPPPDANLPQRAVEEKKPEPQQPKTVTIPAGTLMTVRLDETLRSDRHQSGDSFRATLDQPLVVDGFVIAERGSRVEGRVAQSDPGGRVKGVASLSLELIRLTTSDGQRIRLQTDSFAREGEKNTKKDIAKIGAAAGIGAAIGAIAGGGKGAAIGAGIGGAAGTGGVMATRGEAAEVKAETRLSFRLRDPITITEKL
jgi:hypothetical protein